jgi:hypothetical protein
LEVLGASSKELTARLFQAVCTRDTGGVFLSIDELYKSGKSMSLAAKDFTAYCRDLLALKTSAASLVAGAKEEIEKLKAAADGVSGETLVYLITEFSKIEAELRYSLNPRILLESVAIRAATLAGDDLSALYERVRRLEEGAAGVKTPVAALPSGAEPYTKDEKDKTAPLPVMTVEAAVKLVKSEDAKAIYGRLITHFRRKGEMNIFTLLSDKTDFFIDKGDFVISAPDDRFLRFSDESVKAEIDKAFFEFGVPLKIRVEKLSGEVDMDKEIEKVRRMTGIEPVKEKAVSKNHG